MAEKHDTTQHREEIATAFGVAFLLILALFTMAAPDAVTGRAAPLALEAVR